MTTRAPTSWVLLLRSRSVSMVVTQRDVVTRNSSPANAAASWNGVAGPSPYPNRIPTRKTSPVSSAPGPTRADATSPIASWRESSGSSSNCLASIESSIEAATIGSRSQPRKAMVNTIPLMTRLSSSTARMRPP